MKKAPRAATGRGEGGARAAELAARPGSPLSAVSGAPGFLLPWPPRRGPRRGPLGLAAASGGDSGGAEPSTRSAVGFPSEGLLSVQSSLSCCVIGLTCAFLPTQLSFLGSDDSPRTCPWNLAARPAGASLPRSRPGQQGAGGAEPPGRPPAPPLSPRAEAAAVSCLSVSVCGDRLLFFLYLLSGWGAAWVPVDPTISGPPAVAKHVCPVGPPPSKTSRAPAERQRGHEPRGHLVCVRTCTWPSAVSGPRAPGREDTWASSGQNRPTDRPWRRERFLSAPCPVTTCHHGAP